MKVTVFGGSAPVPQDELYQQAMRLGQLLARSGHVLLTGGYSGTMEAASRGAAEAGGYTIGVTCEEIEHFRPLPVNSWVKEEWKRTTLTERLESLLDCADAYIALPGGPGTLTEISLAWNRLLIGALPLRPLILVGSGWKAVFERLFAEQDALIAPRHRGLLTFVDSVDQAAGLLAPNFTWKTA